MLLSKLLVESVCLLFCPFPLFFSIKIDLPLSVSEGLNGLGITP